MTATSPPARAVASFAPITQEPQTISKALYNEFAEHVTSRVETSCDVAGKKTQYFPRQVLLDYWSREKVRDVLASCNECADVDDILANYLLVFSILVYISRPSDISMFTGHGTKDIHLPLKSPPNGWPENPACKELFSFFNEHQWSFCPLQFDSLHKRRLDQRYILPITFEKRLNTKPASGDVAVVWRVKIHEGYSKHVAGDIVVFKVYQSDDDETHTVFKHETNAYTKLWAAWPYITRCYGSFIQNGMRTIILEYARGGTLLDFFGRTEIPNNKEELLQFWHSMVELLNGLHAIHDMSQTDENPTWKFSGIHGDIQPCNILVFPGGSSSPFDVTFKLADLGTTTIGKHPARSGTAPPAEYNGNRIYNAPECSELHPIQDTYKPKVDGTVDVWALGAVFSEALMWTIHGQRGRDEYLDARFEEISSNKLLAGSGYDAAFHDGQDKLKAVSAMHYKALGNRRNTDTVSSFVSELILDHMLQPRQRGRLNATDTYSTALNKLEKGRIQQYSPESPPKSPEPLLGDETARLGFPGGATPAVDRRRSTLPTHNQYAQMPPIHYHGVNRTVISPGPQSPSWSDGSGSTSRGDETGRGVTALGGPSRVSPGQQAEATGSARPHLRLEPNRPATDPLILGSNPFAAATAEATEPSPPAASTVRSSYPSDPLAVSANGCAANGAANGGGHASMFAPALHATHETHNGDRVVTAHEVHALLVRKDKSKKWFWRRGWRKSNRPDVRQLPGIPEALAQIRSCDGREQLILVDDFSSMKQHKHEVCSTARVISYYIKDSDPNKMEVCFASNVSRPLLCQSSSKVETAIENHRFVTGRCNMSHCLSEIVEPIIATFSRKDRKPVSIYVFTDAVWEPGEPEVDTVIQRVAEELMAARLSRTWVMFQFIRFGPSNEIAEARLRYLDDDIVKKFHLGSFDIVDTRHCNDNVGSILIGSISKFHDDNQARNSATHSNHAPM